MSIGKSKLFISRVANQLFSSHCELKFKEGYFLASGSPILCLREPPHIFFSPSYAVFKQRMKEE